MRTVRSCPSVRVSGVGGACLACSAGQLIRTHPCLGVAGLRYAFMSFRTPWNIAQRSTVTRSPSGVTSHPASGNTPLPRRDRTRLRTAGGTCTQTHTETQTPGINLSIHVLRVRLRLTQHLTASFVHSNGHKLQNLEGFNLIISQCCTHVRVRFFSAASCIEYETD